MSTILLLFDAETVAPPGTAQFAAGRLTRRVDDDQLARRFFAAALDRTYSDGRLTRSP